MKKVICLILGVLPAVMFYKGLAIDTVYINNGWGIIAIISDFVLFLVVWNAMFHWYEDNLIGKSKESVDEKTNV